ncbi:hypothetical protein ACSNOI_04990 [Actinomadura kijaniata]|uniref:hypothetical protein n=1 Tax=Actinomadura kijaniata TaxID=46161 RepID=UPI003F1CD4E4
MGAREWVEARERLVRDRERFGRIADAYYANMTRVAGTSLLGRDAWTPDAPVPLERVRLEWTEHAPPPAVTGPGQGLPEGFADYAEAVGALAAPRVFENRPAYRLLAAGLRGDPVLRFGRARYFDAVNVGEAAAHELAEGGRALRERVGDPRDLARRPALMAVATLTVTASGAYVLHWRDPAKVAHAGGLHQVMPVGVFQQVTDERADLDLWWNITREYGEEFLGTGEDYTRADGRFTAFRRAWDAARARGDVRPYCLGLGVDPLTFAVDLLTVTVVEDAAFAALFGGLVAENDEGRVSLAAFDGSVPEPMQPAGAAALRLAWRHRRALGVSPARSA